MRKAFKGNVIKEMFNKTNYQYYVNGTDTYIENDKFYIIGGITPTLDGRRLIQFQEIEFIYTLDEEW